MFSGEPRWRIPCPVQASHFAHGQCLMLRRDALLGPKRRGFRGPPNLLICIGMANRKSLRWITLPAWHCRICGSVPVLWHWRTFGARKNDSELRAVKMRCGSVTQSGVRFRVCEFSAGGWIASSQDVLPLRSGPPQPSYTAPGL